MHPAAESEAAAQHELTHQVHGVLPADDAPDFQQARSSIRTLWSALGFAAEQLPESLVPTPACGLAGAAPEHVRAVLSVLRDLGHDLVDPVEVS